ncbi:hypothetical protein ACFXTH_000884 [Malus domestica]
MENELLWVSVYWQVLPEEGDSNASSLLLGVVFADYSLLFYVEKTKVRSSKMYDSESNSSERKSAGLNQGWESSESEKRSSADLCVVAIGSAIGLGFLFFSHLFYLFF